MAHPVILKQSAFKNIRFFSDIVMVIFQRKNKKYEKNDTLSVAYDRILSTAGTVV